MSADAFPSSRLYMDAVITPNRSLSKRGFVVLMTILIAINAILAVIFHAIGAIPVPIFLGADVLAVFVAFRVNYNAARLSERVQVSADEVRVSHEAGRLRRTVWRSATAFTRVDVEADEDAPQVRLRISGRGWTVASALSPDERTAFAEALSRAMGAAQAERWRA
jgi:uncharacterized membrane protein